MADSLLAALEELNEQELRASEYASDAVLVIDNDLRTIAVPRNFIFGVYNDKNVLSVNFEMPRTYDDVDLSGFTIQINYLAPNKVGNVYEVTDPVVGEDKITFEWLLDRGVFLSSGTVEFTVCLREIGDEGAIIREFNTTIAKGTVLAGLEIEDPEDPEAYSLLAHIKQMDERVTSQAATVATDYAKVARMADEIEATAEELADDVAEVKEKYGSPLVAPTAAGMIDHTRIYVYTGSETGYTFGNWYYWDGTAWTSGGVYNSTGVNTDSTLSVTGMPADAKATGDEISGLKEDLDDVTEGGKEYIYEPLAYDSINFDRTRQGIRFVQKTDGTVDVSGTNDGTGNSLFGLQDANGVHYFSLSASKTYRLTGCPTGGSVSSYYLNVRKSTGGSLFMEFGDGMIFSPPDDDLYQIVVTVSKDYAVSGTITFEPLLAERIEVESTFTAIDKVARNSISEIMETEPQYVYNPLVYEPVSIERTRQGIRFVQAADGTVQASGTNDNTGASFWGMQDADGIYYFQLSSSKTYRLTGCPDGGGANTYDINIRTASSGSLFTDTGNGVIFTPPEDGLYQICIIVRRNYAISGTMIFRPLLEEQEEVYDEITAVDRFARKGLGLFDNTVVTPQMFGAIADGTTDDSQAVTQADAYSGASVVFFPPGVYNVSGVMAHKSWIMSDGAWITTTTHKGIPVTIEGDGNTYKLNCDYTGMNPSRGVLVTGNRNHIEQIIVKGMVYDSTNRFGSAGLLVTGNHNTVDFARFYDFINDQGDNDSAPQGAALLDNATGNYFADIYTYNARAGFVNAANYGTTNSIGIIKNENSHDNAVYCVRGGHMNIGSIIHDGDDEGLCVITDTVTDLTTVDVGTLFCKNVVMGVRIKNAGVVRIGNVFLEDCQFGLRLDYANEVSEALIIDNFEMKGEMQAPFIFQDDGNRGKLKLLRINSMNIEHDSISSGSPTSYLQYYMRLDTIEELFIGNCNVKMSQEVEEYYDSGSISMTVKSALPKKSYIEDVTLDCGDRTITISPIQQNLSVKNGTVSGTSIVIDNKSVKRGGLCANAIPQNGYWENGQVLKALSNSNIGFYYCTASGTPGTWKSIPLT